MMKTELKQIEVSNIVSSKDNPRIINEKSQGFLELVASVRAAGVMVPIHVQPLDHKFDLRAGERRVRAAKACGHKTIPAVVHFDMSDEEAFSLTFLENCVREDLTPLEEAKAVDIALRKYDGDCKAVADKMGRPESWVRLRVGIEHKLSKKWRKEVMKDGKFRHWTGAHLAKVARFPQSTQDAFLTKFRYVDIDTTTLRELDKNLAQYTRLLKKAPFDIEDDTLVPKAKRCTTCHKRSGFQPALWELDEAPEKIKEQDSCTDQTCWAAKMLVFCKKKAAELKEKHGAVVVVTGMDHDPDSSVLASQVFGELASQHDYVKSQEGVKGAVPVLCVTGEKTGQWCWAKKGSSGGGIAQAKSIPGKPTTLKVRRERLESKRWTAVLALLQEIVEGYDYLNIRTPERPRVMFGLAIVFGTEQKKDYTYDDDVNELWGLFKRLLDTKKTSDDEIISTLWHRLRPVLSARLSYHGPITQLPIGYMQEMNFQAGLLKIDLGKLYDDVKVQKGFAVPKTWDNLNEDGTPKAKKEDKQVKLPEKKAQKRPKAKKPNKNTKKKHQTKPKKETS